MRSVVTGGAGFIGSHLVSRLVELGHEVVVIDNYKRGNKLEKGIIDQIEIIEADVRDESTVLTSLKGVDFIFHFAAVLGVDIVADNPLETMETEILGIKNIAKGAIAHAARKVIYASTSGVYGKAAIEHAVQEEFAVSPSSSYSIAKRFSEIYLKALFQEKALSSIALRFFNVYGPKQDNRMVIPRFFEQAIRGDPITVYGTGGQTRDFTFIDDVVEATVRVTECVGGCEILNVSNNHEYTILELAETIVRITGSKSKIVQINPPGGRYDFEVQRRFGSSEKLRRLVGYCPERNLENGLRLVYDWMKANSTRTGVDEKR